MFISQIDIENFKSISNMTIEFKSGVNLLIGDNGVGKTSVLEAIVVALGGYLNGVNGVSAKSILLPDVRIETIGVGSVSQSIKYFTPVKIGCKVQVDNDSIAWERTREDEAPKRNTKINKLHGDIVKYARKITNNEEQVLPILSYQSSVRASQTRRGDFGAEMKKRMDDRRCGYLGCLDSVLDLKRIKEWCYEMQRIAYDLDRKIEEYEQFKHIVGAFMKHLNELDYLPLIYYSRQHKEMVYEENGKIMPISYLSAGYQSVLWMVMDIAYRLAILNPGMGDLGMCHGIVLIDEIDMHLHPKWQWKIVDTLQVVFPNIQFIIATHSPIIISSCKAGNLILINEANGVIYQKDAYGYSVRDVLEFCQGSLDVLSSINEMRQKFDEAIEEGDLDKADEIVSEMKKEFGHDNSDYLKAKNELELERTYGGED